MRRAQKGAALILFATILVVGFVWFTVGSLGQAAPTASEREIRTGQALQTAKQALLSYVGQYAAKTDHDTPGRFPCPEPLSPAAGQEGIAALNCTSPGPVVGRLPWRTLGIKPLLDGSGEPLWYVLSPGFRVAPINFSTPGILPLDGVANAAVALVVAPGAALNTQLDPDTPPPSCSKRNQAGARLLLPRNPLDFLECGNTSAGYVTFGSTKWINDRALAVSAAEWADAIAGPVADRLQRKVAPLLANWDQIELALAGKSWGSNYATAYLPFASVFSNPASNGYCGDFGTSVREGLLPVAGRSSASCNTLWSGSASLVFGLIPLGCSQTATDARCSFIRLLGTPPFSARVTVTAQKVAGSFRGPIIASDVVATNGGSASLSLSLSPMTGAASGTIDASWPPSLAVLALVEVRVPHLPDAQVLAHADFAWFLGNEWQRHTYYSVSPSATIGSSTPCVAEGDAGCITVLGLPSSTGNNWNKRLVLAPMGRRLAGQASACTTVADCLEGENATTGDRVFAAGPANATFNDRISTCPFQYTPQSGAPITICN